MTTLPQLLAARPKAVDGINSTWPTPIDPKNVNTASAVIREHAVKLGVASYAEACLDSVASLLSAIEAKLLADTPLSDEEIEGMKWRTGEEENHVYHESIPDGGFLVMYSRANVEDAITAQHACVDRLWSEIRRLRAEVGRKGVGCG